MEELIPAMVARELAKIFNKPPDVPDDSEVRKVYESFVEGRKQGKNDTYRQHAKEEVASEPSTNIGEPGLNIL